LTYFPRRFHDLGKTLTMLIRHLPGMSRFGMRVQETWRVDIKTARYAPNAKGITTLGGFQRESSFDFHLREKRERPEETLDIHYVNTKVKNVLKVAVGFALTLATFLHTQTWWFMAWFGPLLWFGITGFRNIIQATLGGGGLKRTPLLGWNAYLSWTRLCDSLLFTGISVPLLEYGVRIMMLEKGLGMNSLSDPTLFYTIMAAVNGFYIAAHNAYRGLPRQAVIGNIFRSVLAVPVSIAYDYIALQLFIFMGFPLELLVSGAAILSKLASDTVAAVIEGFADRTVFLRMRDRDYKTKLGQLLDCYARLEMLMPEEDVLELLRQPKEFMRTVGTEAKDLERTIIVNALDLMYFWMYQPRARSMLVQHMATMTLEERTVLVCTQLVLTRVHEVSQMLVDGLVGMNFAKALSFYLDRHQEYLRDMARISGVDIPLPARGIRRI
jgi:hypothetical protein